MPDGQCTRCTRCGLLVFQRRDGTWTLVLVEHDQPWRCFGELGNLGGQDHEPAATHWTDPMMPLEARP